jgi:hypothetical protein
MCGGSAQGSGTVARIILEYWPQQRLEGWELDPAVLMASRLWMGLRELLDGGRLVRCANPMKGCQTGSKCPVLRAK